MKGINMKKLNIIHYIILIISTILFIISLIISPYTFSYLSAFIFFILLTLFVFSTGLIINKKQFYQKNITKYIILYFILIISLTMFINRPGLSFFNKSFLENYSRSINLIPFKTIIDYIIAPANLSIKIINILGNLIAFIPFSLLLWIKDEKYRKPIKQLGYLTMIVLIIELLQLITSTGRFDIDDLILNIGGALLFILLIKKINITDKIKYIFFQNFHLSSLTKWLAWSLSLILIILVDIMIVVNMISVEQIITQNFYVEEKASCQGLEKIQMPGYNLYLNCVDVIYEADDYYQLPLQEALKKGDLTREDIKEKLTEKASFWDGGTTIYSNQNENITFILCQTVDGNKDIYVGNKYMQYENNYCK